jgi:hypothetical protein
MFQEQIYRIKIYMLVEKSENINKIEQIRIPKESPTRLN